MSLTPTQLKTDAIKEMASNEEIIRNMRKRNAWLKNLVKLAEHADGEAKELEPTAVSDLLDIAKAGLK